VRIRVRRVGGIAGNIALAAELDTAERPPEEAARLVAAVHGLRWGAPASAPPHPDAFRYEVDLPDSPDKGTAVLQEPELAGDLEPLRVQLKEHGVVGPSRRTG
jgi:hypothetical protein